MWSARHVRTGELFAIKTLLHNYAANPVLQERLAREGQSQKALEHPNILRAHGTFLWQGSNLMVMDLVDGESLERYLQRRRLMPVPEVRGVAQAVLSALEHAHEGGVVHRDVKPSNILLSRKGRILLSDFGIALLQNLTRLTRLGAMGTPAYMSPEQIVGKEIDHRTDIYSVGCVLYELLTGTPPFSAEGPEANDLVRDAHRFRTPDPLTARNPSVSPVLEKVVLKAIEKKPEDRYQSCAEFAAALGVSIQWKNQAESQWRPAVADSPHAFGGGVESGGAGRGVPYVEMPMAETPAGEPVELRPLVKSSSPRVHFPGSTPPTPGLTVMRPSSPSESRPSGPIAASVKGSAMTGRLVIAAAVVLALLAIWGLRRWIAPAAAQPGGAATVVESKAPATAAQQPLSPPAAGGNSATGAPASAPEPEAAQPANGIANQIDQVSQAIETLKKQIPQDATPDVTPSERPAPLTPPVAARGRSGVLEWTGNKGPVGIEHGKATAGVLKGDPLPGVPVRLWVEEENGAITQLPSAADGYQRLELNMKTNHARIHWDTVGTGQTK